MSDNTVRLKIKIDDDFKTVEANADDLREAIGQVVDEAGKVNSSLINSNQIAQAFEQVSASVKALQSVMHDLTDAYAVQSAAEARLEQVMRNTMDATDDEIKSIKDLASAQQQLGIVGDEVQLSGAQELATYLSKKESLESLIPVMNDMIAQQYGYNASAESAVTIASMMGKVLDGQVGALSRYGYTFTEAQEQILKFGTEEERAATLAEVVEQSVGGMNEAMAATPYGRIVQATNAFGDLKETLGQIAAPAMNVFDNIARVSIAVAGLGKGVATAKALVTSIKSMTAATRTATVAQHGLNAAMKANIFIAVASAVAALIAVVVKLARESREAGKASDELAEATEAVKGAVGQAKAELDTAVSDLERLMKQGKDTTKAVQELNEKYGESFGYYSTAAEWYDILTKKSKIYCEQVRYEAKAKALSGQIVNLEIENDEKKRRRKEIESRPFTKAEAREFKELGKEIEENTEKIKVLKSEQEKAFNNANRIAAELENSLKGNNEQISWQKMSYADLGKAISDQKKKVEGLVGTNDKEAEAEGALLQAMQKRYDDLGKQMDKLTGKVKKLGDEIKHTPVDLVPTLQSIATSTSISTPEPSYAQPLAPKELLDFKNLAEYEERISQLEKYRRTVSSDQLPIIDAQIALVRQLKDEFEGVNQTVAQMSTSEAFTKGWSGIKGIGNSIRDIKDALTETDNAWDALTQTIDGFISLFQSIQAVVGIIKAVTTATETMTAVEETANAARIVANTSLSTSNTAVAATGAAASVAGIPLVGPEMALIWAATIEAALSSIPKFASGALVYGPTLGLMGEYSGASSNPEVIAPLNKLRAMIGEGGGGKSEVKFRIEGRELVGILNKQNNIYTRSK